AEPDAELVARPLRVRLHPDDEPGVGQLDQVPGRRPGHEAAPESSYPQALAFSRARSLIPGSSSGPSTRPAKPMTTRRPPIGTSATRRVPPGSNRTAAPASTARCLP